MPPCRAIFDIFFSVKIMVTIIRNKVWHFVCQYIQNYFLSTLMYSFWVNARKRWWPSSQIPVSFRLLTFHKMSNPPSEALLFSWLRQINFPWLILIHPSHLQYYNKIIYVPGKQEIFVLFSDVSYVLRTEVLAHGRPSINFVPKINKLSHQPHLRVITGPLESGKWKWIQRTHCTAFMFLAEHKYTG